MSDEKKNDGGHAFPNVYHLRTGEEISPPGMTLRDYFAGRALTGLFAFDSFGQKLSAPETFARYAYQMADAMLAERDKEKKS